MKIIEKFRQIKQKFTAKKTIKALVFISLFLWLVTYVYLFSNRSSSPIFNYEIKLAGEKTDLLAEVDNGQLLNYSLLMPIYIRLCQINLCQNDFGSAKKCIKSIVNFIDNNPKEVESINLYLFVGNIYRDFDKFDQAQKDYKNCLSLIDADLSQKAHLEGFENLIISKARVLNNTGTTYFLLAQSAATKNERWQNYVLAKEYFVSAAQIMDTKRTYLNRIIQTNLDRCSNEMRFFE